MYRRPETKAAEEKVYKQKQIGEFMTTWKDFPRAGLAAWAERQKACLMGTVKSTRYTPRFRPFDMLSIPNQSLVILDNEYHRIGVESVVCVQDSFHRYIDSDMVYFQFCGNSTVETEFGVYQLEPGEVMLVPGGIAHRSIGRNDSLRYFSQSHEAVDYVMKENQYTSQISFEVKRIGGPNWTRAAGGERAGEGAGRGEDAFLGRWAGRQDGGGARLRIARRRRRTAARRTRKSRAQAARLRPLHGDRRQRARRRRHPAADGIGQYADTHLQHAGRAVRLSSGAAQ